MKTVSKAFLRYLLRRRSLSSLQVLGIGCGVAAVIGMVFSARAALFSFSEAVHFLNGRATHSIQRIAGPMDEKLLVRIMDDPAVRSFSPVIDRRVRLDSGEPIRLLGIDPFLDRKLRPEIAGFGQKNASAANQEWDNLSQFLLDERAAVIDEKSAERLGLSKGSTLATSRGALHISGTFRNPSPEPLILLDIGQAQKIFHLQGQLDRVDLVLADAPSFMARWGEGFRVLSGRQKEKIYAGMLDAFRLNLEALSLIALLVGVFLIYNTTMFSIAARRKDAGILASLGAGRDEIIGAFLLEVMIFGILGGLLGGIAGFALSRFFTTLLGRTISDLYFFLRPAPMPWSWSVVLIGVFFGCAASLLGSIFPTLELVRLDPVKTLQGRTAEESAAKGARKSAFAGLAIISLSGVLLLMSWMHVYVGFAGAFAFIFGAGLTTGIVVSRTSGLLKHLLTFLSGLPGKIAAGNIRRNLSRTAVAVAAFMIALSMAIGIGSMIGSFRHSLQWWMDTQILADFYLGNTSEGFEVPERLYEDLKALPGIGGIDLYRNVQVDYRGKTITMVSIRADVLQKFTHFGWLKGGNENWEPVKRGEVVVSESFARNFGAKPGDAITLGTLHGPAQFRIAAVYYDYTTEHGLVMMDRSTYLANFGDRTINSLGIFIDPDYPGRQELIGRVRGKANAYGVPMSTRDQLKGSILAMFDSTFAITRSMRILAIVVAFFGIAGALLTLFIERRKEFGIYRALGFSTRQVAAMTLMEGLGMGVMSFVLSAVVGTVFAVILIKVINLRSFNWTIFFYPSPGPYLLAAATAVCAGIGAAIYPIIRILRTYPHIQLREE